MEKKAGIYKIENLTTGKIYVGSSNNLSARWSKHRGELRRGKHHSTKLQRAWDKYGEESFKFLVLEEVSEELLLVREQHYLDTLRPFEAGYNVCILADRRSGVKASEESIRRLQKKRTKKERSETKCTN